MVRPPSPPPTVGQLVAAVDRDVAGLADAKRRLAVALRRHAVAAAHDRGYRAANLMIAAPTGAGKTKVVRTMLDASGLPYCEVNATQYSETGYAGLDLANMFRGLTEPPWREPGDKAGEVRDIAERWGVVVIDEIDKWRFHYSAGERQVGRQLQAELLRLCEGDTAMMRRHDNEQGTAFSTGHILFVGVGAFEGITDYVGDDADLPPERAWSALQPDHLVRYGFMEELVGRFSTLVTFPPLNANDLLGIITGHIWPQWCQRAADEGFSLVADEAALRTVATRAAKERTGARAIEPLLDAMTWREWAAAEPGDAIVIDAPAALVGRARLERRRAA